jgi:hypothetical protein
VEKAIMILCGLLEDMSPEQRLQLITAAKMCHKFLYLLDEHGEIDRNKVHRDVNENNKIVKSVAKHLGLQETKRLSSPIARRMGKVWVRK